jgi:two-component system CheB/CheR fusion protein
MFDRNPQGKGKNMKKQKANKKSAKKQPTAKKRTKRVIPAPRSAGNKTLFPIVGIGASAGGLEAIEGLLAGVPSGSNLAFVIIQHLAPEHKSIMAQLLRKYTTMQVEEIHDGMKVQSGCVYLNPPNKDVSIMNGILYLMDPPAPHGARLSIDYFFRSLAQYMGDKSICIILSGTGMDGTLGLGAIKEVGGIAIAQEESQARYDNMPKSAIDTGLVDYVLPVEKMASQLTTYIKHPYIAGVRETPSVESKLENHLQKIFMLVRSGTGHDFSHYKRNTIVRRIQRRMAVHQIENILDYIRYLQENPAEVKALFKDLLITVTNFFRDPKAFDALREKVIVPLAEERASGTTVRVWVPGCATGQEAYSVAILLSEAMASLKKHFDVQIFATDMDTDAIAHARQGIYPESIAADVSEERLKQFFTKKGDSYAVKKHIRDMVIFAAQDMIKDAPFSKLDLVCCRNVLIYMDAVLQKKLLPLFHYTLKPGGALFLGTSESIGDFADRFSPLDVKWKIFKHKGSVANRDIDHPITPFSDTAQAVSTQAAGPAAGNIRQIAERTMLQNYAPPCVLVDEKFDILYFQGQTDRYLKLPEGEPSFNILKMAHQDLHYKLGTLMQKVVREKRPVLFRGLTIRNNNELLTINLVLRPISGPTGRETLIMVMFEDVPGTAKSGAKKKITQGKASDPYITALKQELQSAKEYLRTTIEELETSNEELKSTNEELQSTNEELQSTNEELETSREELQSTNEELTTVNTEMQNKVEELFGTNDDLSNILTGAQIGAIFLDNNLNIKRFTPSTKQFFKLIDSDAERPIADIVHTLKYETLSEDAHRVLRDLSVEEKEIETRNNMWVFMRITPYRTSENSIDGVVMTFANITTEKRAKEAMDFAESIIETIRDPILVLDEHLQILAANKSFYTDFHVKKEKTENRLIYEVGNKQWDIPRLRKLLEAVLPAKSMFNNFKVEHDFPNIGHKVLLLNARQIFHKNIGMKMILLAIEDITGTTS